MSGVLASVTAAANKVPIADGSGKLDIAWLPAAATVAGTAVGGDLAGTLPNPTVTAARFATPGPIGSSTPSTIAGTTAVFSGVATALNQKRGTGSPEGVVTGVLGDYFQRTDGGTGTTFYLKESGAGNTGWVAVGAGGGAGTVTSVSVVTANGVSGSVATSTTTPAITLTLGAITPSSVASTGAVTGTNLRSGTGTPEGAVTAAVGTLFERTDGSTGTTLYIKETGAGNTGWVAVAAGGGASAPFADNTALVKNNSDNTKTAKMLCSSQSTGVDMVLDWGAQTADRTLSVPVLTAAATLAVLSEAQTYTAARTYTKELTAGLTRTLIDSAQVIRNNGAVSGVSLISYTSGTSILGGIEINTNTGRELHGSTDGYDFCQGSGAAAWTQKALSVHYTSGNRSYVAMQFDATITLASGANIVLNATTGTKIGTGTTQKLGFWNATPIAQPSGAAQVAVATTAATLTTPYGYTTQAQADAIITLLNEIRSVLVNEGLMKGSA